MRVAVVSVLLCATLSSAYNVMPRVNATTFIDPPGHPWIAPRSSDSRSPCPGLNTLANHGFLPRDGRSIDVDTLTQAQVDGYNISPAMAKILAEGGVKKCGKDGRLDLEGLDAHNVIEHDASLVHNDFSTGNDYSIVPSLVDALVGESTDGVHLTWEDFARARIRREQHLPGGRLDEKRELFACGEAMLAHDIFADESGHATVDRLRVWFSQERFPPNWQRPEHQQGLIESGVKVKKLKDLIDSMRK